MKWIAKTPKEKIKQGDSVETKIAKIRGIKDINRFLNPTVNEMFDPYLIKNIEQASNRIIRAIANNERIVVSYDPDADGITANTIMRRHLGHYTDNVDFIYGERNDGHGVTEQLRTKGLDRDSERYKRSIENQGKLMQADLLILIDSSSNEAGACKVITEHFGCEIIIIDHHDIENENPYALIVNPQQEGDEYPNKQLSGAGVVFKVLQVMEDTLDQVDPFYYMDLVAVGMYADVMRVDVLENRFMIMHGLRNIRNAGLLRILKSDNKDLFKLDCSAIGFSIAPLINGVARMDNIKLAIDLLMEDDDEKCKPIRLKMKKINDTRKLKQKEIVEQYEKKIDSSQKVLIVLDEQSSKGFNGIVAQQLSDKYKRPAIVGRLHKGTASGSFRSNNFDMKSFLLDSGLLEEAMGHPSAGGFTIKEEKLDALIEYIENELPDIEEKEPFVLYDLEFSADEVQDYVHEIEHFNLLTGNGYPKIVVRVNGISFKSHACIGKTMETVKIVSFNNVELIKFRVDEHYASELEIFDEIDVVGQLNINEFYNFAKKIKTITNQIMIEDYKVVNDN